MPEGEQGPDLRPRSRHDPQLVAYVDRTLSDPKAFQPRRPALIKYRFMGKIGTMEDVKRLVWE